MQEQQEEKIYGQMTPEQAEELYRILETKVGADIETQEDVAKQLRRFMRKHRLPFPCYRSQCAESAGYR